MVEHFPALDLFQRPQSEAETVAVRKSGQAKNREGTARVREKLNQIVIQVFHKLKKGKMENSEGLFSNYIIKCLQINCICLCCYLFDTNTERKKIKLIILEPIKTEINTHLLVMVMLLTIISYNNTWNVFPLS